MDPQLAARLEAGPFSEALGASVAASGLSLERIRNRLLRHGHQISVATLSSWQSGRYQPERASSVQALTSLEEILGLPSESLTALLGPPRPRGRRLPASADRRGLTATRPDNSALHAALSQMDLRWDDSLTRLSAHCRLELDAQGSERAMYTRLVLRADRDGPDRWVTAFQREEPGLAPRVVAPAPCRVGKVVQDDDIGLLVAEIVFDRALSRGDTIMVEYAIEHRGPRPYSTVMQSTLHVPVREYVMEVRFDPLARPASCHFFRAAEPGSPPRRQVLHPDSAGSVLAVALSAGPCRLGIRWDWNQAGI